MPRGDKSRYTDKQKRQAEHIEKGYEERGTPEKEAERRAWATVNADERRRQEERLGPRQGDEPRPREEGRQEGRGRLRRPHAPSSAPRRPRRPPRPAPATRRPASESGGRAGQRGRAEGRFPPSVARRCPARLAFRRARSRWPLPRPAPPSSARPGRRCRPTPAASDSWCPSAGTGAPCCRLVRPVARGWSVSGCWDIGFSWSDSCRAGARHYEWASGWVMSSGRTQASNCSGRDEAQLAARRRAG